ncbi:GtrA family protein [Enemella evansiae]|uniref:GtrA family protein n=1 Tax=Enemella evansiae TaxID=2016499 RepID=UPI000B972137|nr:GtrA family protein [Enemella evansiae]PFG66065.1 putative flippase GtrA [Propionibacteriaceae bacterium ES.041]OYO00204.1 polysaccharide synthesis protein GtrA [Enemella evansiae]OYO04687.1 polysaccharide synthesis protein GtrA [Enemella evansiae]OYO04931.1 polysaccharide synthesis protein GtrA [Enemella evansiae]OYO09079.1 polysaccharide synthesis protein GtrA [Enemella evansiae]
MAMTELSSRRTLFDRARSALSRGNNRVLAQMIRYGFVSGLAFLVDFFSMYAGIHAFKLPVLLATTIAFSLGIIVNFITSTLWVFDSSARRRHVEMGLFLLVGVTGLGLNALIVWFGHEVLGIWAMVAKLISTAVVFFWNFLLRRFLIYTPKPSSHAPEE